MGETSYARLSHKVLRLWLKTPARFQNHRQARGLPGCEGEGEAEAGTRMTTSHAITVHQLTCNVPIDMGWYYLESGKCMNPWLRWLNNG